MSGEGGFDHLALHQAAAEGNLTRVHELASSRNVNQRDPNGCTAIHASLRADPPHVATTKLLLDCGADPSLPDFSGDMPFQVQVYKIDPKLDSILDPQAVRRHKDSWKSMLRPSQHALRTPTVPTRGHSTVRPSSQPSSPRIPPFHSKSQAALPPPPLSVLSHKLAALVSPKRSSEGEGEGERVAMLLSARGTARSNRDSFVLRRNNSTGSVAGRVLEGRVLGELRGRAGVAGGDARAEAIQFRLQFFAIEPLFTVPPAVVQALLRGALLRPFFLHHAQVATTHCLHPNLGLLGVKFHSLHKAPVVLKPLVKGEDGVGEASFLEDVANSSEAKGQPLALMRAFLPGYHGALQLGQFVWLVMDPPVVAGERVSVLELLVGREDVASGDPCVHLMPRHPHRSALGFRVLHVLVQCLDGGTKPLKLGPDYGLSIKPSNKHAPFLRFFTPGNGEVLTAAIRDTAAQLERLCEAVQRVDEAGACDLVGARLVVSYDVSAPATPMVRLVGCCARRVVDKKAGASSSGSGVLFGLRSIASVLRDNS